MHPSMGFQKSFSLFSTGKAHLSFCHISLSYTQSYIPTMFTETLPAVHHTPCCPILSPILLCDSMWYPLHKPAPVMQCWTSPSC